MFLNDYYVTLRSDHCKEYYPKNNSSNFRNMLTRPLTFPENTYEVGLVEIYTTEVESKDVPKVIINSGDARIKVEKVAEEDFFVPKTEVSLFSYIDYVNHFIAKHVPESHFHIQREITKEGSYFWIKIDGGVSKVVIDEQWLTLAMGFTTNVFTTGEVRGENLANQNFFEYIPMNERIKFNVYIIEELLAIIAEPKKFTLEELLKEINDKIKDIHSSLTYSDGDIVYKNNSGFTSIQLSNRLYHLLGMQEGLWMSGRETTYPATPSMEWDTSKEYYMVTCSAVENQIFASTSYPLLRIFQSKKQYDKMTRMFFNPIIYVPVRENIIQEIHINILDELGESVPVSAKPSTVQLHFRQKQ